MVNESVILEKEYFVQACKNKCFHPPFMFDEAQKLIGRPEKQTPKCTTQNLLIHLSILQYAENRWIEETTLDNLHVVGNAFIVLKENGSPRLIYDGRKVNEYLNKPTFKLPDIYDALTSKGEFMVKTD
jgi:hypothetical protein